jgi:hypothetical protein
MLWFVRFLLSLVALLAMQLLRRFRRPPGGSEADQPESQLLGGGGDAAEERRRRRELGLRVLIAASIFGIAFAIGFGLDRWHHPPVDAVLDAGIPSAGFPVLLSGVVPDPQQTPARGPAPVEADLRSLRIDDRPSEAPPGTRGTVGEILIRIPVEASSCDGLEAQLGGSCDGADSVRPLRGLESLEIHVAEEGRPASVSIWPQGAHVLELTHSEPSTQRAVPEGRSLRADAARIRMDFVCYERDSLTITTFPGEGSARCSPREATFTLRIVRDAAHLPTISFGELATFEAHARGRLAKATVDSGTLSLGGSDEKLHGLEHTIEIRSTDDDLVAMDLVETAASGSGDFLLDAPRAEATLVDADDWTPSWLDLHERLYQVLAILGAALFAALLDFAIFRRR